MKFLWQRDQKGGAERRAAFGASSFAASSFGASSMALLMIAPVVPDAAADQAKLTVSATVLKRATMKVLAQPTSVTVTTADIARGYVDVPSPAHVVVKSNSPRGYMLDFSSAGDFFREVEVAGLSEHVQLGAGGGAVMQPAAASGVTHADLDLGFRFFLDESARPGTYAWPIRLSVSPA